MKRSEAIFSIVVLVFLISLFIYSRWRNKYIDSVPVYVISKIYRISDAENGFDYYFSYNYKKRVYKSVIRSLYIEMQDSVIVLKISKRDPKLWERVNGFIPDCLIKDKASFEKTWTRFPGCY
jgi:hypothetical protein